MDLESKEQLDFSKDGVKILLPVTENEDEMRGTIFVPKTKQNASKVEEPEGTHFGMQSSEEEKQKDEEA